MKNTVLSRITTALSLALFAPPLFAQVLHVNDEWDNCAIVIDPSLSQESWHQFVSEVGLVTYFRPLASARPLGTKNFEFAVLGSGTRIDDADDAWNDTFSHPDPDHWLFEGDALLIPGLMLRAGVTDKMDIGAYYTQNFSANYGIFGGQLQYNLMDDSEKNLAAAGRVNFSRLFGPEDLSVSVYGLEFVVSKDLSRFSPYAGVSGYVSHGQETTSKVNLENETVFGLQGMVGIAASISRMRIAAEFNLAKVPGYSFKVAFGS